MSIPTLAEAKRNPAILLAALTMSYETRANYEYSLNLIANAYVNACICDQPVSIEK